MIFELRRIGSQEPVSKSGVGIEHAHMEFLFLSFFHTEYHCIQWPRLGSVSDHGLVVHGILEDVSSSYLLGLCFCCLVLVRKVVMAPPSSVGPQT